MKRVGKNGVIIQIIFTTVCFGRETPDWVAGNLQQFNDNGVWSISQNRPVVIDIAKDKLIVGSVACSTGVFGYDRSGDIEAVRCDLSKGEIDWFTLRSSRYDSLVCNSYAAPSFYIRPDGGYLAIYTPFPDGNYYNYRIFSGSFWQDWEDEKRFEWPFGKTEEKGRVRSPCAGPIECSAENRFYSFIYSSSGSVHFAVSDDSGKTWRYGGIILNAGESAGEGKIFCQYAGNGIDRIDIIVSENGGNTAYQGVFHGVIKSGALYDSYGGKTDESVFDTLSAVTTEQLTRIFPSGSVLDNGSVEKVWCTDVKYFTGDTITAVLIARLSGNDNPDYRLLYCMFDGKKWSVSQAARVGFKEVLTGEEYFGRTALDPNDMNTVYISSRIDPRDNTYLDVHEIFRGTTPDHGITWEWNPVTFRSTRDNFNPVVPEWTKHRTAILWMRGNCLSPNNYDASVVGIIGREGEVMGKKVYIDACRQNTINGCCFDSLELTYNKETSGGDNRWHELPGVGNNGTVLVSSEEPEYEDAMLIKMVIEFKKPGIYDFWANFWGKPDTASNWLIGAGLNPTVQLFRQMACRTVDPNDYDNPPIVNIGDSLFLYQAYAGRDTVDSGDVVSVFVDDHVLSVQEYFGEKGDAYRTWFDGVSYARVEVQPVMHAISKRNSLLRDAEVRFRYLPKSQLIKVVYYIGSKGKATVELFDLQGKRIVHQTFFAKSAGTFTGTFPAGSLKTGAYMCRLTTGAGYSAGGLVRVIR